MHEWKGQFSAIGAWAILLVSVAHAGAPANMPPTTPACLRGEFVDARPGEPETGAFSAPLVASQVRSLREHSTSAFVARLSPIRENVMVRWAIGTGDENWIEIEPDTTADKTLLRSKVPTLLRNQRHLFIRASLGIESAGHFVRTANVCAYLNPSTNSRNDSVLQAFVPHPWETQ